MFGGVGLGRVVGVGSVMEFVGGRACFGIGFRNPDWGSSFSEDCGSCRGMGPRGH